MSDSEFAIAVLSNQLNFNKEGYRLKQFPLVELDDNAERSFTKDLQKYISHIAKTRLCLYKRTMKDIKVGATRDILEAAFASLLHLAALELDIKGYTHHHFLEFLADVCTYTRWIHLKGIEYPKACPGQHIRNILSKLRGKYLFSDTTFIELDVWISNEIKQYEKRKGRPMSLYPVEVSLDWVNCRSEESTNNSASGSCTSRNYEDNIGYDVLEKSDVDMPRKRLRI